jgi:hypothetical protein
MADYFKSITDDQADLISNSKIFFIASADPTHESGPHGVGPVNLSPKGGVPLHIIDRNRVAYLDYAGSGNETARHAYANGPITVMICSFEQENAAVVRLYGKATITSVTDSPLGAQLMAYRATVIALPERQIIDIAIDSTVTSCGYGVPVMTDSRDRTVPDRGRRYKDKK